MLFFIVYINNQSYLIFKNILLPDVAPTHLWALLFLTVHLELSKNSGNNLTL